MKRMMIRFNARNQVASFHETELDVEDMHKFMEDMQHNKQVMINTKDGRSMLITVRFVRSVEIDTIPSSSAYERMQQVRAEHGQPAAHGVKAAKLYNRK